MFDLLNDRLIRVRRTDGTTEALSLPGVYQAMMADDVAAFTALRPHQRHAWHAFLAQLGVIALVRGGRVAPARTVSDWRQLLRGLTTDHPHDEPWHLVVLDAAKPAFMQCPALQGLGDYGRNPRQCPTTPDDLDLLSTSKNHDIKKEIASEGSADDWIFALINLQTMSGFLGAGNYGIARMNGGFSSRPCLGFAPVDGGMGAHLVHDMGRMMERRGALLDAYEDYFHPEAGKALLWLTPWDGTDSLSLRVLDPYFIEVCRRVRLRGKADRLSGLTATSKKPRIAAKQAKGVVGDHWTPVNKKGPKALSVSGASFRYDRLKELVFNQKAFKHPQAMMVDPSTGTHWRLVARGVAAGQGKTDGYHERTDVVFGPKTTRALFGVGSARETLATLANAQIEEVAEVIKALRFGVAIVASGGKDAESIGKADWERARPYARRFDMVVDAMFFGALQDRFEASGDERAAARVSFVRSLIDAAKSLLAEAIEATPCPAVSRYRARARASSGFWGRLYRSDLFGDQPEILDNSTLGEKRAS